MFYRNKDYSFTKTITISALLIALVFALKIFTVSIPLGGVSGIRVGFGGPFLNFVGILFGPVYGGIAPLISDIGGYLLKPEGAYIWPLSLVAFLKGFSIAALWHSVKKVNFAIYNSIYLAVFSGILFFGLFNLTATNFFVDWSYTQFIMGLAKKSGFISIGLIITGFTGILFHIGAWFVLHKNEDKGLFERYLKLVICIGLPSLLFTTVNTFILIEFLSIKTAFIYFWIPRLIEEMFMVLFNVYVLITIMSIYEKVFKVSIVKAEV